MKISKLHINQFRHLENLDFDFTYPEDFHIEDYRLRLSLRDPNNTEKYFDWTCS